MSGIYVVQNARPDVDFHRMALLQSNQMSRGSEPVNHYAISQKTLLGAVSPDTLSMGIMPRFLADYGKWGLLLGRLYESSCLAECKRKHPSAKTDLEIFAALERSEELRSSLPDLNGAFFLVLWDAERERLITANDRFGLYPMYWSQRGEGFCLASRVLCSVLAGTVDGAWDSSGVAQVLTTDDLVGAVTMAKGVHAYPPATVMTKRGGEAPDWHRYWEYDYTPASDGSRVEDFSDALSAAFLQSVKRRTAGVEKVGVTLSGGLDSRCLVDAATQLGVPLDTYTWGKKESYDRRFAKRVAEMFSTTHHDCDYECGRIVDCHEDSAIVTEGMKSTLENHMLAHLDILAGSSNLNLDGFAGDVVLGGSFLRRAWDGQASKLGLAEAFFSWRNALLPEAELSDAMPDLSGMDDGDMPSTRSRMQLEKYEALPGPDRIDRFILENRQRRSTAMGTVQQRCALETAPCFFDYDFVDLATAVPSRFRIEHRVYKAVMRRGYSDSFRVPWQRTLLSPSAPEWAAMGAKGALKGCRMLNRALGWPSFVDNQSPVDFATWLREPPLGAWMESICNDAHPVSEEVLRAEFCARTFQEHERGADRTVMLGTIATLRAFSRALERARSLSPAGGREPAEVVGPERET